MMAALQAMINTQSKIPKAVSEASRELEDALNPIGMVKIYGKVKSYFSPSTPWKCHQAENL
jgi:serine protease inhibitor